MNNNEENNIKILNCPNCGVNDFSEKCSSSLGIFYCSKCSCWHDGPKQESKNILVTKIYTDLGKLWEIANQENNISLKAAILNMQGIIIRNR